MDATVRRTNRNNRRIGDRCRDIYVQFFPGKCSMVSSFIQHDRSSNRLAIWSSAGHRSLIDIAFLGGQLHRRCDGWKDPNDIDRGEIAWCRHHNHRRLLHRPWWIVVKPEYSEWRTGLEWVCSIRRRDARIIVGL